MTLLFEIPLVVVPVLLLLIVLHLMDSFRLIKFTSVLQTIVVSGFIALFTAIVNGLMSGSLDMNQEVFSRYVSPLSEELLKSAYLFLLIKRRRIGVIVDGAIYGFAIGAGFAVVENLYYLLTSAQQVTFVWIVRGLGAATMHATATFVVGITATGLLQKTRFSKAAIVFISVATAVVIHSVYNHLVAFPVVATIWQLIFLPPLVLSMYRYSVRSTRKWLEIGLDNEVRLLEDIMSEKFEQTKVGVFLQNLKRRLPTDVVGDLFCYLRVHLELSIRAKGILLQRGAGFLPSGDPEILKKLEELKFLECSVGKTAILSIAPFLRMDRRTIRQLHLLSD